MIAKIVAVPVVIVEVVEIKVGGYRYRDATASKVGFGWRAGGVLAYPEKDECPVLPLALVVIIRVRIIIIFGVRFSA